MNEAIHLSGNNINLIILSNLLKLKLSWSSSYKYFTITYNRLETTEKTFIKYINHLIINYKMESRFIISNENISKWLIAVKTLLQQIQTNIDFSPVFKIKNINQLKTIISDFPVLEYSLHKVKECYMEIRCNKMDANNKNAIRLSNCSMMNITLSGAVMFPNNLHELGIKVYIYDYFKDQDR